MSQFQESLPSTGSKGQSFRPGSARRPSHPQAAHKLALVLGGGGAAGNAWEIGIIAGVAEAGLDMTEAADLVIGTSSGATGQRRCAVDTAGRSVRLGAVPARQPAGQNRGRPPALPMATVFERMRAISAAATSAADQQRAMGAFGLECDSILESTAGQHRAVVAARLPRHEWPARPIMVVAIDTHTGELATFDRDSGVDLVDAVTAGTALPGSSPTIKINGTHYINGGVRSPETPTSPQAMQMSSCSRRSADAAGPCPKTSSRACADHRNGAWTWRARSRLCASRAAASR